MKAITLTQPWASLVAIGAKHIETRSWATKYRGPIAIHAGKGLGPVNGKSGLVQFCTGNEYVYKTLNEAGLVPFTWNAEALLALPRGAIVATAWLAGCVPTDELTVTKQLFHREVNGHPQFWNLTEHERAFGDYSRGRYAWMLADIQRLPTPIPAKGALGLWGWTPSEGIDGE